MRFKKKLFVPLCLVLCSFIGYEEPWGEDAKLYKTEELVEKTSYTPVQNFAKDAILFHQNIISLADGPRSSFRPTSSRYALLAIQRYGFWTGFLMGCDRLMRENSENWLYRTVEINGKLYKYDPALLH